MQNRKSIPMITVAVSCIVILLAQGNIEKVYALSSQDVTLTTLNNKCVDKGSSVYYFVVEACQGGSLSSANLERYKFADNSLVNTIAIKSLRGNITAGITTVSSGNNGVIGAVKCFGNYCWITRTGTVVDQLQKWNTVTGLPVNYKNYTVNKLDVNALVIGTNELWGAVNCAAGAEHQATAWTTSDNMNQTKQIGTCAGAVNTMNPAPNQVDLCYDCGGSSGMNRVVYGAIGSGGNNVLHVFDGTGLTRNCASSLTNSDTVFSRASIAYLGNSINKFAIARTGNDVLIINNNDLCTVYTTITSTELGSPANYIRGIDVNIHNGQWMVYHSSSTLAKVAVMDLSSLSNLHNLVITLAGVGSGMETNSFFATDSSTLVIRNKVFETTTSDTARMWTLDDTGTNPSESSTTDFCAIAGNENLLTCRLNEINNNALAMASQTFGNSTNDLFVQIGLVPEGSDIRTNGVGYILVAVGLGLLIAIFFLASQGELGKIPTFVWVLGALVVVGMFAAFQIIDATFFIITILIIIALASAKILSALERF